MSDTRLTPAFVPLTMSREDWESIRFDPTEDGYFASEETRKEAVAQAARVAAWKSVAGTCCHWNCGQKNCPGGDECDYNHAALPADFTCVQCSRSRADHDTLTRLMGEG